MKLYNEKGEKFEADQLYDENGNMLNNFINNTKDDITDAFETSWLLGFILLIISPGWGAIYFTFFFLFKLIKFILKIIWWIIRFPFCLIFLKRLPYFNKHDEDDGYYIDLNALDKNEGKK